MKIKPALATLVILIAIVSLYLYSIGFRDLIFFSALIVAIFIVLSSEQLELLFFLWTLIAASVVDPLRIISGEWGYSTQGWYIDSYQSLFISIGWGIVAWICYNLAREFQKSKIFNYGLVGIGIVLLSGFVIEPRLNLGQMGLLFMVAIFYMLEKYSTLFEKALLYFSLLAGLIVELCGVYFGIWWYDQPGNLSLWSIISISFSYPLVLWFLLRISRLTQKSLVK